MIYLKYLWYVLRHKWFVFLECLKQGQIWRGITHDLSKFYPDEFIPYSRYFYGNYSATNKQYWTKKAFDIAWLKHQHRNPHHWQHWILQNDEDGKTVLEMPLKFAKEMYCDWVGAGIAITGKRDIKSWFDKNKDKIVIHDMTRNIINSMVT